MSQCPSPSDHHVLPKGTGPALIYRHSNGDTFTLVDRVPVAEQDGEMTDDDHRERLICRAILEHALAILRGEDVS